MAKHNFHFKSPQEMREQISKSGDSEKKRNKILIIIFADLMVLAIIVVLVYSSGFMDQKKYTLTNSIVVNHIEYSGSVVLEKDSKYILFLNILNQNEDPVDFPPENVQSFKIQAKDQNNNKFTTEFSLSKRNIVPGETTIYRTEIVTKKNTIFQTLNIHISKNQYLEFHSDSTD